MINSYKNTNLSELDNKLQEEFEIKINATENIGNLIYLNPFVDKYNSNPFLLNNRTYPVDFGYRINKTYIAEIEIPESYSKRSIPKEVAFSLPNMWWNIYCKNTEK